VSPPLSANGGHNCVAVCDAHNDEGNRVGVGHVVRNERNVVSNGADEERKFRPP